jgi:hypothetical protein
VTGINNQLLFTNISAIKHDALGLHVDKSMKANP